ncbi:MAG TPA: hypothetical protein VJ836_00175 [Candidatus Saccharimonadales bacterium]|nr:hypothetical protein [Candidatus Saccharimonadales bacterium]
MIANKSAKPILAKAIAIGLLAGITIWILLLLRGASLVRDAPIVGHMVRLGPFNLTEIQQIAIPEGYRVSLTLQTGLLWFILTCIVAGFIVGLVLTGISSAKRNS